MGLTSTLRKRALGISQRALERLLADEQRAQGVASVVGAAQRGKQAFDVTRQAELHQLNLTTRSDFQDLGRRLSALTKRVVALSARLEAQGRVVRAAPSSRR